MHGVPVFSRGELKVQRSAGVYITVDEGNTNSAGELFSRCVKASRGSGRIKTNYVSLLTGCWLCTPLKREYIVEKRAELSREINLRLKICTDVVVAESGISERGPPPQSPPKSAPPSHRDRSLTRHTRPMPMKFLMPVPVLKDVIIEGDKSQLRVECFIFQLRII